MVRESQKHNNQVRRWNRICCGLFPPSKAAATADISLCLLLVLVLVLVQALPSACASAFPSASEKDQLLQPRLSTARTLLQAQQGCPVNFENLNYTIITSRCKGPRYPPNICCEAFKDFACPYSVELNDQTNNCATTMFSYINLNGHYPPGLFANECRDSKRGLECTEAQSSPRPSTPSAAAPPTVAQLCLFSLSFLFLCRFFLF